jgi:hypothetical protein
MADTLDRDHIEAGLALLRADIGLVVYPDAEGFVPEGRAEEYVRVYTSIERPLTDPSSKMDGRTSAWVVRWYCHSVGSTEHSATAVGMRVRAAMLDVKPTITGRVCGFIRFDSSVPTNPSDTTGVTIYDKVDVYRMRTSPSANPALVDP